jgi:hypothetical protein
MDTVASVVLHTPEQLKRRFFNYLGYIASHRRFNASYDLEKKREWVIPCPQNNK